MLVDARGDVVAVGRNHAYDPPTGSEVLERTPIAHAELNVLARVSTDRDLRGDALWSSQEPCSMCTAAAAFVGVGAIEYVAPDPWALSTGQSRAQQGATATEHDSVPIRGPATEPWRTVANGLFLLSIAATRGPDHATFVRSRDFDPDAARMAIDLLDTPRPWPATLGSLLDRLWAEVPTHP